MAVVWAIAFVRTGTFDVVVDGARHRLIAGGVFITRPSSLWRSRHYVLALCSRDRERGKQSTQRGRATELFVRTNGRWVHTSWHLDGMP
jgi:hypothetical protein